MGCFIVIEGLNGVGKTSLARDLAERLARCTPTRLTEEPDENSCAGGFLRRVLRQEECASEWTQALAFAANRADHLARDIEPYLRNHPRGVIISDRYYHSSLVYQARHDLTIADIRFLNKGARVPDLTLYLEAEPAVVAGRLRRRKLIADRYDSDPVKWRRRYDEAIAFLRAEGQPIYAIDASGARPTVLEQALRVLAEHGPPWLAEMLSHPAG